MTAEYSFIISNRKDKMEIKNTFLDNFKVPFLHVFFFFFFFFLNNPKLL